MEQFVPGVQVDRANDSVIFGGRTVQVAALPISVDVERLETLASMPAAVSRMETLRARYGRGTRQRAYASIGSTIRKDFRSDFAL